MWSCGSPADERRWRIDGDGVSSDDPRLVSRTRTSTLQGSMFQLALKEANRNDGDFIDVRAQIF